MDGAGPESVHAQASLLLLQARTAFASATSMDDRVDGAARAAGAMSLTFELLDLCPLCSRRRYQPSCACYECGSRGKGPCEDVHHSSRASNGPGGCNRQAEQAARRRIAFLETSYVPFALFLLREVGPAWLIDWEQMDTKAAPEAVARGPVSNDDRADRKGGEEEEEVSGRGGTGSDRAPVSARAAFFAFFRSPEVPACLVLQALCEALGKSTQGNALTARSPYAYGKSPEVLAAAGAEMDRGPVAADPRTVQLVCRLLRPFLNESLELASRKTTCRRCCCCSSKGTTIMRNADAAALRGPTGDESQARQASAVDPEMRTLLACAIAELAADATASTRYRGNKASTEGGADSPLTLALSGGDAAHGLASVLCLAPRRVANCLGPIAPPSLAPDAFFPTVCRAVVWATLRNLRKESASSTDAKAASADVWKVFSERLLSAGRAPDLSEAWLYAMAGEAQRGFRAAVLAGGVRPSNGPEGSSQALDADGMKRQPGSWEAWVEGPDAAIHASMICLLPAARRKPFTEALLRVLWPRKKRRRDKSRHEADAAGEWPVGFPSAACLVLIGRPLLATVPRYENDMRQDATHSTGGLVSCDGEDHDPDSKVSVGIVEQLLLQRPLPHPAAEAFANMLAWCDRQRGARGDPVRGDSAETKGSRLLLGAVKRVAAIWGEPSFLNRSPPRQQELYTSFLLAALSSGGIGSADLTSGDAEVLALLIRGVGSHLDVAIRETRLRGMRVGEAVAALSGQQLRFAELDAERTGFDHPEANDTAQDPNGDVQEHPRAGQAGGFHGKKGKITEKRTRTSTKRAAGSGKSEGAKRTPGPLTMGEDVDALDPDMLLPLGDSDSDGSDTDVIGARGAGTVAGEERSNGEQEGSAGSSARGEEASSDADTISSSATSDDSESEGGDPSDDDLEAYDLWDDEHDLAPISEPVYLDQLIELLRSREQPETADKHEMALRYAEALIRRRPPDLPHRAAELSRDLLYLENAYDLEGFHRLRAGAMVATVTACPETCALYYGSEVWSSGPTEGTKLEMLDILVQAASELAGWTITDAIGGGDAFTAGPGSRLMEEPRGMTQASTRLLQQRSESSTAALSTADAIEAGGGSGGGSGGDGLPPARSNVEGTRGTIVASGAAPEKRGGEGSRTRRWGYRRGPREELRSNLFGRYAPQFFYPLAHGMVMRLRQSAGGKGDTTSGDGVFTLPRDEALLPPQPSAIFSARFLHALTCLVELSGTCPATPALAADLLGLAWLLRDEAGRSRELRRAVLLAVATGVERSQDGAASGALQGHAGEFLRWLQSLAAEPNGDSSELATAVLAHASVQALAYF